MTTAWQASADPIGNQKLLSSTQLHVLVQLSPPAHVPLHRARLTAVPAPCLRSFHSPQGGVCLQKQGLQATGILANVCKRTGIASASALLSGSSAALLGKPHSGVTAADTVAAPSSHSAGPQADAQSAAGERACPACEHQLACGPTSKQCQRPRIAV